MDQSIYSVLQNDAKVTSVEFLDKVLEHNITSVSWKIFYSTKRIMQDLEFTILKDFGQKL